MTFDFNTNYSNNRKERNNMRQMNYSNYNKGVNIRGKYYNLDNNRISAADIREVSGIKPGRQIMAETDDGMITLQEGKSYSVPPQARFKDAPAVRKASDSEALDSSDKEEVSPKRKALVVMDCDRMRASFDKFGYEFDAKGILDFSKTFCEDSSVTAYAYLDKNPRQPNVTDRVSDELWRAGFIAREVKADSLGMYLVSNKAVAIVQDVLCSVYENNVDLVVMIGPDGKLVDLAVRLREKGIEVAVMDFGQMVDYDMSIKASGFINLEYCFGDDSDDLEEEKEPDEESEKDESDDESSDDEPLRFMSMEKVFPEKE